MKLRDLCEILTEEFAQKVLSEKANASGMACDILSGDAKGVTFDSREVKDGYIFVAITGVVTDQNVDDVELEDEVLEDDVLEDDTDVEEEVEE